MQALSCPIPANINPLQSNGFLFSINKLPQFSYFCQEVNIPELVLPFAEASSTLVMSRIPGDKPVFGDLTITFLVDENMDNYVQIHNWLVGLGFPESQKQYAEFIATNTTPLATTPQLAAVSDGTLQILNSSNNAVRTISFVDLFPTSLSSVQMTSTSGDTTFIAGVATFGYTYYKFV